MPFSDIKDTDCVSLQVHKSAKNRYYNIKLKKFNTLKSYFIRKRACLFASFKGSITLEATIVMSIVMMIILFVESFMVITSHELMMQIHINNTVESAAKNAFYIQASDKITSHNKTIQEFKQKVKQKYTKYDEKSEITNSVNLGYLTVTLLSNLGIDNVNDSYLVGGMAGIRTGDSSIKDGVIDLAVNYKIKIPFIRRNMEISQRARVKDWTGTDITKENKLVYITKNGEVYHKSKTCRYLNLNIKKSVMAQIETLRNNNGGKYKPCKYCGGKQVSPASVIYVTSEGDRYHINLNCGGLTRKIMIVDITQVGDKKPCSVCGQGE